MFRGSKKLPLPACKPVSSMLWCVAREPYFLSPATLRDAVSDSSYQGELEMDMLREQVSVHRTEFANLEASTTRKISELELLLVAERDKASDPVCEVSAMFIEKVSRREDIVSCYCHLAMPKHAPYRAHVQRLQIFCTNPKRRGEF